MTRNDAKAVDNRSVVPGFDGTWLETRRLLKACFLISIALASEGCKQRAPAPQQPETPTPLMKAAPQTPISEKRDALGGKNWEPAWDAIVERQLPANLLSPVATRAVRSLCPNFAKEQEADKRAFWAYFFQALAGAEAGLDPTTVVHHTEAAVAKTDAVTKRPIHQEGLLQLTYEDSDRYHCGFDWEHDRKLPVHDPHRTILDPATNLGCGIKIVENQIITQNKPLLSHTSYWSTLQPGTMSYRAFSKQMANVPEACKAAPRHHHG